MHVAGASFLRGTWDASSPEMSLIERFVPECTLHQVDRVAVAADPELAYRAARWLDVKRLPFSRLLFGLRALPERLHGRAAPERRPMTIDRITGPDSGFAVLGERPGCEIVVGSIGKFWLPQIEFVRVPPESFAAFAEPGYGKLAWSFRVDARAGGGAWVAMDLRVTATDSESLAAFERYWRVIGRFSHLLRRAALREIQRQVGGVVPDAALRQPGDELLPATSMQATHAIDIEAPPERVWPWLVQMGCQRAGWYSHDWLDNARIVSANQIVPELQAIAVGDVLPARPHGADGFAVLRVEPERVLLLGSPELLPGAGRRAPYQSTWCFSLEPIGEDATRLIVRARAYSGAPLIRAMLRALLAPAHELMQREQLTNLKRRAESAPKTQSISVS